MTEETNQNNDQKNEFCKKTTSKFFLGECDFKIGATKEEHIPLSKIPEVAFAGLSNVGKSSLINALTNRNSLARTSSTPGRTQQINFFLLRDKIMLVDLPGYGYAKVSRSESAKWHHLTIEYLRRRANLERVFLLIDSRRGLKDSDRKIMDIFDEAAVNYQVILTKCDKTKQEELVKIHKLILSESHLHVALHPKIIQTSSLKKNGLDDLRYEIMQFIK